MTRMPAFIQATYQGENKDDCLLKAKIAMDGLADHPDDAEYIYAWTANFLRAAEKYQETIEHCDKVFPLLTIKECREFVLAQKSFVYETLEQWEACIEVKKQLVVEAENKSYSIKKVAETYEKINDIENAIIYYEKFITACDGRCDNEIFTKLAFFYDKIPDYENSFKYFQLAARNVCSESVWMWFNAGRALALMGKQEEAFFYFEMILKISPDKADAHYMLGQLYQNKSDVYRALHHYTEALKIKPEYPMIYNNLAALSFNEEGDISESIKNIETALAMNPDSQLLITLYLNLARLYKKISDYDKHEYYQAKMMEAIGFPVEYGDDEKEGDDLV